MNGNELVENANKAFENSQKQLAILQKEMARQDQEMQQIHKELQSLGLNPEAIDLIPKSILSLTFPKELSGVANSFKQIMQELQNLNEDTTKDQGKKTFNPINKLKML